MSRLNRSGLTGALTGTVVIMVLRPRWLTVPSARPSAVIGKSGGGRHSVSNRKQLGFGQNDRYPSLRGDTYDIDFMLYSTRHE